MLDSIAMAIGYCVMVPAAIIAALLPIWIAAGYAGKNMYRRLTRIYSMQVVWYWLNRLEAEGKRCFEKAEEQDQPK